MAEWIIKDPEKIWRKTICSNCNKEPIEDVKTPYCPWCGEKMTNSFLNELFMKARDAMIEEFLREE